MNGKKVKIFVWVMLIRLINRSKSRKCFYELMMDVFGKGWVVMGVELYLGMYLISDVVVDRY